MLCFGGKINKPFHLLITSNLTCKFCMTFWTEKFPKIVIQKHVCQFFMHFHYEIALFFSKVAQSKNINWNGRHICFLSVNLTFLQSIVFHKNFYLTIIGPISIIFYCLLLCCTQWWVLCCSWLVIFFGDVHSTWINASLNLCFFVKKNSYIIQFVICIFESLFVLFNSLF